MKKSLIALAVLAASGAAMAQSSVQIYGDMDLGIAKEKRENVNGSTYFAPADLVNKTGVDQGLISGGNIGFKGTEDLGGGLKAIFKVETDFAPDAPSATSLGNKYAYVGLAGGFGEVQLGTVGTAYDDFYANSHSALDSDFAATYFVFENGVFAGSANNGIKYVTPSFAGFSGAFTYAFGENKVANNTNSGGLRNSADSAYTIGGQYENGPIYVAAAYGSMKDKVVADLTDPAAPVLQQLDVKTTGFNINGSYDFGVAKLKGTYASGKQKELDATGVAEPDYKWSEYEIAVDVPVTSALMISAGYAKSQDKDAGVKTEKRTGYSLSAFYTLSKRTMVYAGYNTADAKDETGAKVAKSKLYAVGIQHKF